MLIISMLAMSYTATSSIVNELRIAFPAVTDLAIDIYSALPTFMVAVFSIVSGRLSAIMSKRQVAVIAAWCCMLGGVAPFFFTNFTMLIISRLVLGLGIGLMTPLMSSIISDHYNEEKRIALVGYSTMSTNIGLLLIGYLAGVFCLIDWHYSYLVYAIVGVPSVIAAMWMLPRDKSTQRKSEKYRFNKKVFKPIIFVSLYMGLMYTIYLKLSPMLAERGIGDASFAGMLFSLMAVGGILGGVMFGWINRFLGKYQVVLNYVICGLSFLIISFSENVELIAIVTILVGFGNGSAIPVATEDVIKKSTNQDVTMDIGLMIAGINLWMFFLPILMNAVVPLINIRTFGHSFIFSSICLLISAVAILVLQIREKESVSNVSVESRGVILGVQQETE